MDIAFIIQAVQASGIQASGRDNRIFNEHTIKTIRMLRIPFLLAGLFQIAISQARGVYKDELIQLHCPGGCPVLIDIQDPPRWTQLYPGWLMVNLSVVDSKVYFNHQQLWPEIANTAFEVSQLVHGDFWEPYKAPIPVTASVIYEDVTSWRDQILYPIQFRIKKVLNKDVTVESLKIEVVKSPDGSISLMPTQVLPYASTKPVCTCSEGQYRIQQMAIDKFEAYETKLESEISCTMEETIVQPEAKQEAQHYCKSHVNSYLLSSGFWLFSVGLMALLMSYLTIKIRERYAGKIRYAVVEQGHEEAELLTK